MRVEWLGHACFLITASDGTRIITDPYDRTVGYRDIGVEADIVTVSHEHFDHNFVEGVGGSPEVVRGPGRRTVKGIEFVGVETFHDTSGGAQRGRNTAFLFEVDGVRICHLGDLGHVLSKEQAEKLGEVDLLLVPVGGTFTIGPKEAWEVVGQLKPKVVIPMHFKTPAVNLPISPVEEFVSGRPNVKRVGRAEVELTKESLPHETEVWVLEPSRG